jgi:copper chaperone CopZ
VSVALKKIEGVESATVSLKDGRAILQLKEGNTVRLEQLRKAVSEQGFTPKEARVTAVADLAVMDGQMQLKVTRSNDRFAVAPAPHETWREKAGTNLLVNGLVAAPRNAKDPGVIQLLEVSKQPPKPK